MQVSETKHIKLCFEAPNNMVWDDGVLQFQSHKTFRRLYHLLLEFSTKSVSKGSLRSRTSPFLPKVLQDNVFDLGCKKSHFQQNSNKFRENKLLLTDSIRYKSISIFNKFAIVIQEMFRIKLIGIFPMFRITVTSSQICNNSGSLKYRDLEHSSTYQRSEK